MDGGADYGVVASIRQYFPQNEPASAYKEGFISPGTEDHWTPRLITPTIRWYGRPSASLSSISPMFTGHDRSGFYYSATQCTDHKYGGPEYDQSVRTPLRIG